MKVIYILGCSRCGSTVLNSILGNHEDAVGLGEFEKLLPVGWLGEDYCGCGIRVAECPFWSEVRCRWTHGGGDVARYHQLSRRFQRLRQLPRILIANESRSTDFAEFASRTRELFKAVSGVSGATVIVDSSKNPVRGMALCRVKGLDVRLIHLVRDPRGMAASLVRGLSRDHAGGIQQDLPPRPVKAVAREWNFMGRVADWLLRSRSPDTCIRVRFESLLEQPEQTIQAIGRVVGIDLGVVAKGIANHDPIQIGPHMVAGNRIRMQKCTTLWRSDNWEESLDPSARAQVERQCARRMLRYGYTIKRASD